MTGELIKQLAGLDFDSLTAKEAVLLRRALSEAQEKANGWFLRLAEGFSVPVKAVSAGNGRPPETTPPLTPTKRGEPSPVKTSPRRRGRPVPNLKVDFKVKPRPEPLAIGGADAATEGPQPAQLFQESYVSKDGPQPGARLPADHPRNTRVTSVTPDVDMSDFHEVEEAMRKGELGKVFQ